MPFDSPGVSERDVRKCQVHPCDFENDLEIKGKRSKFRKLKLARLSTDFKAFDIFGNRVRCPSNGMQIL